ncbi:hypothetical protein BS50DRAFT_324924 [Corynespora cassiicola Philippines]|uniref:Uncharacterized protein n=1 Tax=Corynespora cassiicola Philippines TaxID=1448308 RepID=A0A2T2NTU7_CORCC|nr:hypothetical protein BS50DRAFT_324924 [Corynespora cassiicola Philippines]
MHLNTCTHTHERGKGSARRKEGRKGKEGDATDDIKNERKSPPSCKRSKNAFLTRIKQKPGFSTSHEGERKIALLGHAHPAHYPRRPEKRRKYQHRQTHNTKGKRAKWADGRTVVYPEKRKKAQQFEKKINRRQRGLLGKKGTMRTSPAPTRP